MTGAIRRGWPAARDDLLAALPGWAVARVLVLGALAGAHFLADNLHVQDPAVRAQVHQGLFAWDAGFYRGIAQHGYGFGAVHHDDIHLRQLDGRTFAKKSVRAAEQQAHSLHIDITVDSHPPSKVRRQPK